METTPLLNINLLGTHPLLRMQNYRKIFKCEKFSILFSFIIYNFAVEI